MRGGRLQLQAAAAAAAAALEATAAAEAVVAAAAEKAGATSGADRGGYRGCGYGDATEAEAGEISIILPPGRGGGAEGGGEMLMKEEGATSYDIDRAKEDQDKEDAELEAA